MGQIRVFFFGLMLVGMLSAASGQDMKGKQVGVYISSSAFQFDPFFNMQISQFLTQGEDRSDAGRLKAEFMIRIGWMLCEQLDSLTQADSVYFLNADPPRGRAFKEAYNLLENTAQRPGIDIAPLDYVLVLHDFDLGYRTHLSSYVLSSRVITEKVKVKKIQLQVSLFDAQSGKRMNHQTICFDDQEHDRPDWFFNFYRQESPMGKFLSKAFSQWWAEYYLNAENNCK